MADRFWVNPNAVGGSWNSTASWSATSGGTAGASVPTAADDVYFDYASSSIVGFVGFEVNIPSAYTAVCRNFYSSAPYGVLLKSAATTGNLTISGSADFTAVYMAQAGAQMTGTITFNGTGTGANAHGIVPYSSDFFLGPVVINGTGEFVLRGSIIFSTPAQQGTGSTGTFTLSAGTLRLNGQTIQTHAFISNNSTARTLDFGCPAGTAFASASGGNIQLYDQDYHGSTVTNPLQCATVTNMTLLHSIYTSPLTGQNQNISEWSTFPIYAYIGQGNGAVAKTSTYAWGSTAGGTANRPDLKIIGANTSAVFTATLTAGSKFRSIDTYSFSGTVSNTAISVRGGIDFGTSTTWTSGTNAITIDNTQTIIGSGFTATADLASFGVYYRSRNIEVPITINGSTNVNNYHYFADLYNTLRTITLTQGHIQLTSYNNFHSFSSSNSNIRSLTLNGNYLYLNGTGTVWDTSTVTNFTYDDVTVGGGVILWNNTNTSRTFNGGARYYRYLAISGSDYTTQTNGGVTVLGGGSSFGTLVNDRTYWNHTLQLTAGTTTTVHYLNSLSGADRTGSGVGNNAIARMTITSTAAGTTAATLAKGGPRRVNQDFDYVTLNWITASPAGVWYIGNNCTLGAGNSNLVIGPADRYWVGGVGTTINWATTANWSTSSGGTGGATVPTAGSVAFFDGNSGTGIVNIAAAATAYTINSRASSITFSGASAITTNAIIGAGGSQWASYTGTWTCSPVNHKEAVTSVGGTFSDNEDAYLGLYSGVFGGNLTIDATNSPPVFMEDVGLSLGNSPAGYIKGTLTLTRGVLEMNNQFYSTGGGGMGMGGFMGFKIVCTAMNEQYGFGSFRNAIWLKYAEKNLTKAHEVGYHTIFLPLVEFAYRKGNGRPNLMVRKALEWIARHRSVDLRAEMRGTKRDLKGRIVRMILEPLCYVVGKIKGY